MKKIEAVDSTIHLTRILLKKSVALKTAFKNGKLMSCFQKSNGPILAHKFNPQ